MNAVYRGVTYFDEVIAFFTVNQQELAPEFLKMKGFDMVATDENQKEIQNMHDAFIAELKVSFSAALSKDRLYNRPCGFLNDQQIWMVGVNEQYFLDSALRFDHVDFMKALKFDLGPVMGDVGLWSLKCL
jgi:hypothetical protein